jgi:hypothetical protein
MDDDEWREVLRFAERPGAPASGGPLIDVDVELGGARYLDARTGATRGATLAAQDRSPHLKELVRQGQGVLRVDADVAEDGGVTALRLLVRARALDARLRRGALAAEACLVALAMDVWREARVPPPAEPDDADAMETEDEEEEEAASPPEWRLPLFAHQRASLRWMRALEAREAPLRYPGNLRLTDAWYVDTEAECLTTDPSWREAQLLGGICADGTGTGKTATVLHRVCEDAHARRRSAAEGGASSPLLQGGGSATRYASAGTLVVLPLNLVSQWQAELAKFVGPAAGLRAVWLVQGKDVRQVSLADLCAADLVVTTLHFLRASKPYAELVDAALRGQPRTRPVLTAWARQPGHVEPLVEAVTWRRVVVDEVHQCFESARDLRALRLLQCRRLWGLTATPGLDDAEQAQQLYSLLLRREKAHHPNLLAALLAEAVRASADEGMTAAAATAALRAPPELQLVQLSLEERLHLQASEATSAEEVVRLCTFVSSESDPACEASSLEEQFRASREAELVRARAKVAGHARAVAVLERSCAELEAELLALAERCAAGADPAAEAQAEVARAAVEAQQRDLARARGAQAAEEARVARVEASAAFVRERVAALRAQTETCAVCLDRPATLITPCAHLFCSPCAHRALGGGGGASATIPPASACPACRAPVRPSELTGVLTGIGTKLSKVGELLLSLAADEPVILFVQWKAMVRGVRAFLKGLGLAPLLLDGNAAQRAATLAEFQRGSGVLLLCLEDSFAGLHLPHARHVVFAHAIVGDRRKVAQLERQAIARCARYGQTGEVRAYSFVVAHTAEERVWRSTH